MHLWLHDVNRPAARVPHPVGFRQIMHRTSHGDHRVHDALGGFFAVHQNRVVGHQVTHVAHQHQRTTGVGDSFTIRRRVGHIAVQTTGHDLAALVKALFQRAFHQAQPVRVDNAFVLSVDSGDRVFAVLNGGQCAFQTDVRNASRIRRTNRALTVDLNLDQQAVDAQHHIAVRTVARVLGRVCQSGRSTSNGDRQSLTRVQRLNIRPRPIGQRCNLIQMRTRPRNDLRATCRVVTFARRLSFDRIRAVERIIERPPTCVRRVQRKAGVHHRHNQLRTRDARDLWVYILDLDLERCWRGLQIADLAQERVRLFDVKGLALLRLIPRVDLRLQVLALFNQSAVHRHEVFEKSGIAIPECISINAEQDFIFNQRRQISRHFKRRTFYIGHSDLQFFKNLDRHVGRC